MKKIVTIVGARPQFIKAAAFSRALEKSPKIEEILVHTGQHYDKNMSESFFQELSIPKPQHNLGVGSGSHGEMTGEMLQKIEKVLFQEKPALLLIYGDTNSTLAGALAASKLHIPVAHVEAGLRSFNRKMPEEVNRVLSDHLSSLLFCPTQTAIQNLQNEGIAKGVIKTGDIMLDCAKFYGEKAPKDISKFGVTPKQFALATLHRAENVDDPARLPKIFQCFEIYKKQIVLPVHPRTKKMMGQLNLSFPKNVIPCEPVSYLEMVSLEKNASFVFTDSGGVQKEAFFWSIPCITLREETEWVETVEAGWNSVVGANPDLFEKALKKLEEKKGDTPPLFGNGRSAGEMLTRIEDFLV